MDMTVLYFLAFALAIFVFVLVVAFALGKRRSGKVLAAMGGITAIFATLFFWGWQAGDGWDAVGSALILFFFCAPIALGNLIGGLTGWLRSGD